MAFYGGKDTERTKVYRLFSLLFMHEPTDTEVRDITNLFETKFEVLLVKSGWTLPGFFQKTVISRHMSRCITILWEKNQDYGERQQKKYRNSFSQSGS